MINKLMQWKVYINRSLSYVGLLNSLLLVNIVLKQYNIDQKIWLLPILIITSLILLILGWVEIKLGFMKAENNIINNQNPLLVQIDNKLDKLDKLLEKK
jgi:hypothetical protein